MRILTNISVIWDDDRSLKKDQFEKCFEKF